MLLINFKAYKQSSGKKAIKLAKICEKVSKKTKVKIGVVPNLIDLRDVSESVNMPVFSQHLDPEDPGAHTGAVVYSELPKKVGVVLNHSEDRLDFKTLKKTMKIAKDHKIKTVICAQDVKEVRKFSKLKPDYVAVEPPELIGSKTSVSEAKPEIIEKSVKAVGKVKLLVGAGINSTEDVKVALNLGAKGVFVASAVCKAKNPEKILKELAEGFKWNK